MKKTLLALSLPVFLSACTGGEDSQIEIEVVDFSAHTSQADLYNGEIKALVDTKCSTCHGKGLKAGKTKLLFVKQEDAGNLKALQGLITSLGGDRLVSKATGNRHGGGKQITSGGIEAQALQELASRVVADAQ